MSNHFLKTCYVLLLVVGQATACAQDPSVSDLVKPIKTPPAAHILTDTKTRVRQSMADSGSSSDTAKFVQFEITELVNPGLKRISFKVYLDNETDQKPSLLGSFAPFPANNPGRFIVATQGKVDADSTIILSMQMLDEASEDAPLQITIEPFSFRD